MNFLQIIVLGLIQGFSEFLPISSSGHLILVEKIFGTGFGDMAFDVFLHLGTLVAVLIVLWSEFVQIFISFFKFLKTKDIKSSGSRLWLLVLVGIIPAGLVGFFFDKLIEEYLRNVFLVAFDLIFFGLILWLAERKSQIGSGQKTQSIETMSLKKSFQIGLWQILALLPGTSRSGITITGGLFGNISKEVAVKFSFLMSIPLILGANIFKVSDIIHSDYSFLEIGLGFVASLLAGLIAIKWLLRIAQAKSFKPFVIYRLIVGIIILILFI